MNVVAVIPARYSSSRFPGKPLVDVAGKPMIQRVYEHVSQCPAIDSVMVATDDDRIRAAVLAFGGRVVMTDSDCPSGTDRVARAVSSMEAAFVINVQGDQVALDGEALVELVATLKQGSEMATIAIPIRPEEKDDPNCVKVVTTLAGNALYFSRSPIPYARNEGFSAMLKHIGIYGFRKDTLMRLMQLAPTPLEQTESLEQLRALEHGIPIRVIVAKGIFHEINTPDDLERLLSIWTEPS